MILQPQWIGNTTSLPPHMPFPAGPAVGGDGGAVDPPTQGAVQRMDKCFDAWLVLDIYVVE